MSDSTDVIRWSFEADPIHAGELEAYLEDLGIDVYVKPEGRFTAIWEEPDGDPDEVVDALWKINGAPFDVTYEEFRRTDHLVYETQEPVAELAGFSLN
jgi:hypothetical protein